MRTWFMGTVIGAALVYFFAPPKGSARRQGIQNRIMPLLGRVPSSTQGIAGQAQNVAGSASQKAQTVASSATQTAGSVVSSAASTITSKGQTLVQQTVRRGSGQGPDNPNPDDQTLKDRVESELFRHPGVPKGDLNINVAGGVVVIRGQLDSQEQIQDTIDRIRSIPDVKDVQSFLHLPGEPAPNKESALEA